MPKVTARNLESEINTCETLTWAIEARIKHPQPDMQAIAFIAGQLQRKAKACADFLSSEELRQGLREEK